MLMWNMEELSRRRRVPEFCSVLNRTAPWLGGDDAVPTRRGEACKRSTQRWSRVTPAGPPIRSGRSLVPTQGGLAVGKAKKGQQPTLCRAPHVKGALDMLQGETSTDVEQQEEKEPGLWDKRTGGRERWCVDAPPAG